MPCCGPQFFYHDSIEIVHTQSYIFQQTLYGDSWWEVIYILLSPHVFSMVESREPKIYGKIKI